MRDFRSVLFRIYYITPTDEKLSDDLKEFIESIAYTAPEVFNTSKYWNRLYLVILKYKDDKYKELCKELNTEWDYD